MTSTTFPTQIDPLQTTQSGIAHQLALALVALMVMLSAVVFTEPAPVDVIMLGLLILLPTMGLVRITPQLFVVLFAWLVIAAAGYVSAMSAQNMQRAVTHVSVTLFLSVGAVLIAGFVMRNPARHTTLIYNAHIIAALIAATAGIIGYFGFLPGTQELFTMFDRARGPFKDPNVFGPFLIPAILYCLTLWMDRTGARNIWPTFVMLICMIGILLSFSRGAWLNVILSGAVFGYFAFVTAPSNARRAKLLGLGAAGAIGATLLVLAALQIEQVANLMADRAAITHSYDVGPSGRTGGMLKAIELVLQNPLGIGAQEFVPRFHLEEPHNVYISMFLNHGWIGGGVYLAAIIATIAFGFGYAATPSQTQPLFLIAYASFIGNAAEGAIIDTDHWRHFFMLFGILWGLMLTPQPSAARR